MKKYLIIMCIFLLCPFATVLQAAGYQKIEDQSGLSIETPALAEQKIRKLRLSNGMDVLLISDKNTEQSGAALAVGVGSWQDPEKRPGMAHFVEHLLFLGTEKYPDEADYSRYLDEHGGMHNAFTMSDRTVYMFSVNNDALLPALDRFSQFFIAPLFSPSGVERESKAIHQEFCRDLPMDDWRMHYVKKEIGNPKHPFHRFCIGNLDTLAKISHQEVKQWYQSHYSANLMHLVVHSAYDLDTLENEVVSLFSPVKNCEKQSLPLSEPLFEANCPPQLCLVNPVQSVQLLELCWEVPRFYGRDRELHVEKLISQVLGHEGSSSLLAQLKREKLAESLAVGHARSGHDQCLFSLTIELTERGVKEYETVIERCFQALATLKQNGIPRYLFDELCQMELMRYRFQPRQEIFRSVTEHATQLLDEPLETYPRETLLPSRYAPEKISELLTCLNPKECHYTLMASPELTKKEPTLTEKWLGVEYALVPIAEEKIHQWSQLKSHKEMAIPRPNPFLPKEVEIIGLSLATPSVSGESPRAYPATSKKSQATLKPNLIYEGSLGTVYAATDKQFLVPEICWIFNLKTPAISDGDPKTQVAADFYCHAVEEALKPITYEALMGGLSFSLQPKKGALELKIQGYSDQALTLLDQVLTAMKSIRISREQFALYRESFARSYANAFNASPLKQGSELLWSVLFQDFTSLEQKSEALYSLSYAEVSRFSQNLLRSLYIEAMLYGNLNKQQAEQAWTLVEKRLDSHPYPPHDHPHVAMANLPKHDHPAFLPTQSNHPANALILATDCGHFSFKRRAAQEILTKGLEEPFFSELRTRQQTAYLVSNWGQELEGHLYSFFAVQSSSHDPRDLLARFELFLESSVQEMQEKLLTRERFEAIREAHIQHLKHPAETLSKMGSLLHALAFQYGDFELLEKQIAATEALSYEECLECAHEFLGKENRKRLAIGVHGDLPGRSHFSYRALASAEKLRSEIFYQSRDEIAAETTHSETATSR